TALGQFEQTGKLRLMYHNHVVASLDMEFLHHGRPKVVRHATWRAEGVSPRLEESASDPAAPRSPGNCNDILLKILSSPNVCSKEWIVRQYDHEVQGGTVIKPLVGAGDDGPGDAAVIMPLRTFAQALEADAHRNGHSTRHPAMRTQDPAPRTQEWVGL